MARDYNGPDILTLYLLPEFQELFDCPSPLRLQKDDGALLASGSWPRPAKARQRSYRAQIEADLERVARDECSIMVMDSQNRYARTSPG